MTPLRLFLVALLLMWIALVANGAPRRYIYVGAHPTENGPCQIAGAHTHGKAPDEARYTAVDGQWIYRGGEQPEERPLAAPRRDRSERKRDRASSCPFHD